MNSAAHTTKLDKKEKTNMETLQQIAESYIPDPSNIDPSGQIIDTPREIAEALMLAMPYEGEFTPREVFDAVVDRVVSIRNSR